MHLKLSADFISFLHAVKRCDSDVYLKTQEGDCLNLKSELSKFVFATLVTRIDILQTALVVCTNEEDYQYLEDYLEN